MEAKKLHFETLSEKEKIRFWDKVVPVSECWEWTGCLFRSGYGNMRLRGRSLQAHRISWFITSGEDPFPLFVLHRCDNRKCCRPSHLFLGTNKDNMSDAAKKGRMVRYKLDADSVKAIRNLLQDGVSQRAIASRFLVSQSSISDINIGKSWAYTF